MRAAERQTRLSLPRRGRVAREATPGGVCVPMTIAIPTRLALAIAPRGHPPRTGRDSAPLARAVFSHWLCTATASAQDTYPSRPITLIVPYAAGGSIDLVARILAEGLTARLDQTVVVDDKPGGNGVIGIGAVIKAEARRLHAADGLGRRQRHARRRAEGLSVRSAARLRAGRDGGGVVGDPGGEEGSAGQHARRVRRLRQGAAGRAQLRHHRLRQLRASGQRSVHAADRHRDAARAVQGRRRRRPTICSPARSTRI